MFPLLHGPEGAGGSPSKLKKFKKLKKLKDMWPVSYGIYKGFLTFAWMSVHLEALEPMLFLRFSLNWYVWAYAESRDFH